MEKIKDILLKVFRLENLAQNLTGYVEARLDLFKNEIKTDIARAIANAITMVFLGFIGFLFVLFLSIGLAYFLNTLVDSEHAGFWIVGGIYGLLFLVFKLNLKVINTSLEEKILDILTRKNNP